MVTEFWGMEVKPGHIVSCGAGNETVTRTSQVALGETKRRSEDVALFVKVVGSKFVIGTLRAKSHPHMMNDLIFDKEFELSHSSEAASVFFCGYKAFEPDSAEDEDTGISNGNAPAKNGCKKDDYRDDDFPSSDDMDTYEDSISSTDNLTLPTYPDDFTPVNDSSSEEDEEDVSSIQTYEHEGTSKKIGKTTAEIGLKPASVKENVAPSCQKSGGKTGCHVAKKRSADGMS